MKKQLSRVYLSKRNFPQNLESGKYFSRRWSEPEGEIWCRRISNHFSVNLQSFDGINPRLSIQHPILEQFWRWMSTCLQECVTGSLFLGAPTCFSLVHVQPVAPRQTSGLPQIDFCKSSIWLSSCYDLVCSQISAQTQNHGRWWTWPWKKNIGGRCPASNWERNASCFVKRHMELHCEGTRTAPKTCATAQFSVISTSQAAFRKGWIDPK